MKIVITRAGGYDPALGPRHPSNQDPTLEAHVVTIDTCAFVETSGALLDKYKWRCSCGEIGKRWRYEIRNARNGGAGHVAAMELGR